LKRGGDDKRKKVIFGVTDREKILLPQERPTKQKAGVEERGKEQEEASDKTGKI